MKWSYSEEIIASKLYWLQQRKDKWVKTVNRRHCRIILWHDCILSPSLILPPIGTNLNDALLGGLSLLESTGSMNSTSSNPMVCILFVLTDGKPSEGVTSLSEIERNVRNANNQRCSIVTLGFGRLVNYNFLVRLALQNRGMARKIYEDSSAAGQLRGTLYTCNVYLS